MSEPTAEKFPILKSLLDQKKKSLAILNGWQQEATGLTPAQVSNWDAGTKAQIAEIEHLFACRDALGELLSWASAPLNTIETQNMAAMCNSVFEGRGWPK